MSTGKKVFVQCTKNIKRSNNTELNRIHRKSVSWWRISN